jgi:hypothetical protein
MNEQGPVEPAGDIAQPQQPSPQSMPPAPPTLPPPVFGPVTEEMVQHLRNTKPWVRFLSILAFVGSGLMIVGAFFMLLAGTVSREFGAGLGLLMAFFYLLFAVLYIYPSLMLFKYASSIQSLVRDRNPRGMTDALRYQSAFWRFAGILAVVVLCVYALVLIVLMFVGIAGLATRFR